MCWLLGFFMNVPVAKCFSLHYHNMQLNISFSYKCHLKKRSVQKLRTEDSQHCPKFKYEWLNNVLLLALYNLLTYPTQDSVFDEQAYNRWIHQKLLGFCLATTVRSFQAFTSPKIRGKAGDWYCPSSFNFYFFMILTFSWIRQSLKVL